MITVLSKCLCSIVFTAASVKLNCYLHDLLEDKCNADTVG
jgi:hypothetical protein